MRGSTSCHPRECGDPFLTIMIKYFLILITTFLPLTLFAGPAGAEETPKERLNRWLFEASAHGNALEIAGLLEEGANVNSRHTTAGMTPFHRAIQENHLDVVSLMLESGGDLELGDLYAGDSGIHYAVFSGNIQVLRYVLQFASNRSLPNRHGDNALHIALRTGRYHMLETLLAGGVDMLSENERGISPVTMAERVGGRALNILRGSRQYVETMSVAAVIRLVQINVLYPLLESLGAFVQENLNAARVSMQALLILYGNYRLQQKKKHSVGFSGGCGQEYWRKYGWR